LKKKGGRIFIVKREGKKNWRGGEKGFGWNGKNDENSGEKGGGGVVHLLEEKKKIPPEKGSHKKEPKGRERPSNAKGGKRVPLNLFPGRTLREKEKKGGKGGLQFAA